MKMNKSRLIRNVLPGDLGQIEILNNVGLLPIVQNTMAFYEKNFKGQDYWEKIKKED